MSYRVCTLQYLQFAVQSDMGNLQQLQTACIYKIRRKYDGVQIYTSKIQARFEADLS